jgi:hypothetical protein
LYTNAEGEVTFGDLFASGSVFHDAYLRSDATSLGQHTLKGQKAERLAEGLTKGLNNRSVVAGPDGINVLSPAIPLGNEEDALLAHGLPTHAIVLSDECDIEEVFGRGGKPKGRLLFASVSERPVAEINAVALQEPFDRFALPASEGWPGGVAELRRVFMVDVRAIDLENTPRVTRLDDALSQRLAITWAAYATRRGPLAASKAAEKLALLLSRGSEVTPDIKAAALSAAQTVAAAWTMESEGLDGAAIALEEGTDPDPVVARLIESLQELAIQASAAAAALDAL